MELFKKIIKYYKPYAYGIALATSIVLLCQIANIFTAYFLGKSIDAIVIKKDINSFFIFLALYGVTRLLDSPFLAYTREQVRFRTVAFSIPNGAREESLKHYFAMSERQHKDNNFLLSSTIIQDGMEAVIGLEMNMFQTGVPLIAYTVVMLGLLFTTNIWFFVIAIAMILFFALETYRLNRIIYPRLKKMRDKRQETRGKRFRENLLNINLIKSTGQEEKVLEENTKNDEELTATELEIWTYYGRWTILRSGVLSVGQICILLLGGILISKSKITPGSFVMVWMCVDGIFSQLWNLGQITRQTIQHITNIDSYFKFLDLAPALKNGHIKVKFDDPPRLELKGVNYKYIPIEAIGTQNSNQSTQVALKDINLVIEAGESVGLVGPSGAGKTTLVGLFLRSDDPTSGEVLINDQNLKDLDQKSYKHQVGYVSQQHEFFDRSFKANITFPLNGDREEYSDEDIFKLCKKTRIDHVIDRYSKKLYAKVGDRAKNLSGGEMQRLSITRMLTKDPKLVILDEATASLDADNEVHIQNVIEETSKGRTTIIIAHRISTLRLVKKIVVMNEGEIVAIGSHDELMSKSDLYKDLVSKQQMNFS